jgi:ribosomal protein L27
MRSFVSSFSVLLLSLVHASMAQSQGIVVDQGQFRIVVDGRQVGTEEFSIRRAGIGRDDALFATGVVVRGEGTTRQEVTPLLRASPPDGVLAGYQVKVAGRDALDFQLSLVAGRYVAVARSPLGDEEREFPAREDTRLLDRGVAHHYYFLRDVRPGDRVHVIEPGTRTQGTLLVIARTEADLTLDGRIIQARRIELTLGEEEPRVVWYDRLGRVLRVEIPALRYVAERTDLVG